MPISNPPASQILRRTNGYQTLAQAAARIGVSPHTLYTAARRGALERFYYRGINTPTGWLIYLRKSDIDRIVRQPIPKAAISIKQACEILGITRFGINHYLRVGRLRAVALPFAGGGQNARVWLDRQEVEALAKVRGQRTVREIPPALLRLVKTDTPRPATIARILLRRPPGVKDIDIARAFGVSRQRIHQIKREVLG